MKVVGYIRVSTQAQAKDGESLTTQRNDIRQFVKHKKDWKLVNIYSDKGISGSKTENREGFMQMIKDAEDGGFQGIVFSRLSRFARNAGDFLRYSRQLKDKGIQLYSIKENIDPTSNTGNLMIGLLALIAEWERESIREQMSENKMGKWRENRTFIGKPPYGYIWNKKLKELQINKDEALIYKRIIDMYINLGISFHNIAAQLKEEGIKCKKKFFQSATISAILKNPCYYGHYIVNKFFYGDGKKGVGAKRTKKLKPESEHITFKIPPLITKTEWDRVQEKTKSNIIRTKRSSILTEDYWLKDILECGYCGGRLKPHHGARRKDGSFPRYYGCYWAFVNPKNLSLSNKNKCSLPLIKAEELELLVWMDMIMPLSFKPDKISSLIDPKRYDVEIRTLEKQIHNLESDLKKNEITKDRILDILEDEKYEKNVLKERLTKNRDEKLKIEAKLLESRQKLIEINNSKANKHLIKDLIYNKKHVLRQLVRELDNLSPNDKKMFAESLIDGKVKVMWGMEDSGKEELSPYFDCRFNITVFEELVKQKKIGAFLDKNGSDDTA